MFLIKKEGEDEAYAQFRDHPKRVEVKQRLLELWSKYKQFAPKEFKKRLQDEFFEHWWEMYCGVGLLNCGCALEKNGSSESPDLHFTYKNKKVYIEAVAPGLGEGEDALPSIDISYNDENSYFPENEFLLRLSHGLVTKAEQLKRYISKGIISENDILIIAISSCKLALWRNFMDYPVSAIDKVLNDVGYMGIYMDSGQNFLTARKGIVKRSGAEVSTSLFSSQEFSHISAVLYSYTDPLNDDIPPEDSFTFSLHPNLGKEEKDLLKDIFKIL